VVGTQSYSGVQSLMRHPLSGMSIIKCITVPVRTERRVLCEKKERGGQWVQGDFLEKMMLELNFE